MRIINLLWKWVAGITSFFILLFTAIWFGWIGYVPQIDDLENPINKFASQVYSSDKALLGTWSLNENRIFASKNEIAPCVYHALIATEDKRFYEHYGIDARSVGRAIIKRGILGQRSAGGGSTITQQLAKQLYTENAASNAWERVMQKAYEWVIAVKLERYYAKDEILTLYLNYFDFLHQAVGIKSAAKIYFNKEPGALTVPEAAMLIGMCKNPSYYNPVRDSVRVTERRNVVLSLMEEQGYLSSDECKQYQSMPLGMHLQRITHREGIATYFREYLRQIMMAKCPTRENYASWQRQEFVDDSIAWETDPLYGWCNKNFKKDGSPYNIYTDGLKIYTSIDSRMQRYAERAVREHMQNYLQPIFNREKSWTGLYDKSLSKEQVEKIINRSILRSERYRAMKAEGKSDADIMKFFKNERVSMTVYTSRGEVDTLMTPRDSILHYKRFLRAGFMSMDPTNGLVKAYVGGLDYAFFQYDMVSTGRRQVGSTIKPYLYALAMQNGYTPCDLASNVATTYIVDGKPWRPRGGGSGGMMTLKSALTHSNNTVSAYLINKLTPAAFVQILRDFGIHSLSVYPSMSLCLGSCDLSVSEMISGYSAFANKGIRVSPIMVTRIENNKGEVVAEFHPRMHEVISAESSYKMIEMMRSVVDHGTGRGVRAYGLRAPIAGKTGTTNQNSDAWFIGFIPRLVSGGWVGAEDRDIHFNNTHIGQGAGAALPMWARYMRYVYADTSLGYRQDEQFDVPKDFISCESPEDFEEIVIDEDEDVDAEAEAPAEETD